jgi:hypothetical protein
LLAELRQHVARTDVRGVHLGCCVELLERGLALTRKAEHARELEVKLGALGRALAAVALDQALEHGTRVGVPAGPQQRIGQPQPEVAIVGSEVDRTLQHVDRALRRTQGVVVERCGFTQEREAGRGIGFSSRPLAEQAGEWLVRAVLAVDARQQLARVE